MDENCDIAYIAAYLLPLEVSIYFPDTAQIPDEGCLVTIQGILLVQDIGHGITLHIRGLHLFQ